MINSPEITDAEFAQFQKLIYKIAGISMADTKKVLLVGRLSKRLRHYNFSSYGQYYRYVTSSMASQELQLMVDLLTTNETYFFRESKHFDFLKRIAGTHPAGRPFAVWSAAASTGEEIYTICMVLADVLGIDGSWTVTGSDISLSVLKTAEAGHYVLDRTRGLPPEYLRKYCLKGVREQEGTFLIDKRLRSHTRFLQVNLNNELPELGPFDVIFLRNVMIYFDQDTKRQVVRRLIQKLRPGGYLLVGHSETLNGISDDVSAVQPTIYRKP